MKITTKRSIFFLLSFLYCLQGQQLKVVQLNSGNYFDQPRDVVSVRDPRQGNGLLGYIVLDIISLHFCTDDFKIIKSIGIGDQSLLIASKSGKYILHVDFVTEANKMNPIGQRVITMYDSRGSQLFSKVEDYYWDAHEQLTRFSSDMNGNYYELNGNTSTLTVFSQTGNIINSYNMFDNKVMRLTYSDISEDGSLIAIIANKGQPQRGRTIHLENPPSGTPAEFIQDRSSGEPHLFLFDVNGLLKKIVRLEEEDIATVAVSPTADIVLASVVDIDEPPRSNKKYKTQVFSAEGEELFQFPHISNHALINDESIITSHYLMSNQEYLVTSYRKSDGVRIFANSFTRNNRPVAIIPIESHGREAGANSFGIVINEISNDYRNYNINIYASNGELTQEFHLSGVQKRVIKRGKQNNSYENLIFIEGSDQVLKQISN